MLELIGIVFNEYGQDGQRVWSAEMTCGTPAVTCDWKSASFAVMQGCAPDVLAQTLRETADRLDAMQNAVLTDTEAP